MSAHRLAKKYLFPLINYLVLKGDLSESIAFDISMVHSRKADEHHSKSARSFCYVILSERDIHYASSIARLPDEFIVGIILHEIVHMIVEDEKGDPELLVDEWIAAYLPEAGYAYKDVRYPDRTKAGERMMEAKNLECVSKRFLKKIGVKND